MPSAVKHDLEFAEKGLVTILMERQGADQQALEAFLLDHWPECRAFACVSGSVPTPEFRGIPHAALVGVDGTLLWDGSPIGGKQDMEALIDAELAKVKKGWGDTADARKVRALLFGKGDFAGAQAAIAALPEGEERTALQGEFDRRYAVARVRIAGLRAQGRTGDAHDAAKDLLKGVGRSQLAAEVQTLVAEFDGEAAKAELALDKKLEKVCKQLADGKDDAAKKGLQSLLKSADAAQSPVAKRAERLLRALEAPKG